MSVQCFSVAPNCHTPTSCDTTSVLHAIESWTVKALPHPSQIVSWHKDTDDTNRHRFSLRETTQNEGSEVVLQAHGWGFWRDELPDGVRLWQKCRWNFYCLKIQGTSSRNHQNYHISINSINSFPDETFQGLAPSAANKREDNYFAIKRLVKGP